LINPLHKRKAAVALNICRTDVVYNKILLRSCQKKNVVNVTTAQIVSSLQQKLDDSKLNFQD